MAWIIVLDEDWGYGEETRSLGLAVWRSQQPCYCQISKTGINHRPQALSSPPVIIVLFFSSTFISYILSELCPCLSSFLLWCLLSSFLLCDALHRPTLFPISSYPSSPLIKCPAQPPPETSCCMLQCNGIVFHSTDKKCSKKNAMLCTFLYF